MPNIGPSSGGKKLSVKQSTTRSVRRRKAEASPASLPPEPTVPADGFDFGQAREETIRVAAYYLAEKRGFVPGMELDDWLIAERQIDARLNE
jgi:hypothetical protein